jgi:hypothetical protein
MMAADVIEPLTNGRRRSLKKPMTVKALAQAITDDAWTLIAALSVASMTGDDGVAALVTNIEPWLILSAGDATKAALVTFWFHCPFCR